MTRPEELFRHEDGGWGPGLVSAGNVCLVGRHGLEVSLQGREGLLEMGDGLGRLGQDR